MSREITINGVSVWLFLGLLAIASSLEHRVTRVNDLTFVVTNTFSNHRVCYLPKTEPEVLLCTRLP